VTEITAALVSGSGLVLGCSELCSGDGDWDWDGDVAGDWLGEAAGSPPQANRPNSITAARSSDNIFVNFLFMSRLLSFLCFPMVFSVRPEVDTILSQQFSKQ